jgi:hypothetical protein
MINFHDFFHVMPSSHSPFLTDISVIEVVLLDVQWSAKHSVRDNTLFQKLCDTLKGFIADTHITAEEERYLLKSFSRARSRQDGQGRCGAEKGIPVNLRYLYSRILTSI